MYSMDLVIVNPSNKALLIGFALFNMLMTNESNDSDPFGVFNNLPLYFSATGS
jgi:hypothetical protein